jgi:long-chain acyl-CoA synthetase
MQKIWLDSYPPGVPAEVQVDRFGSLTEMFRWACERFRTLPAFSNQGATIGWQELDRHTRNFAAYLQGLGLRKGDRVALMLPNVLQYPIALFGAFRAGCSVVNVNPLYTARELRYLLVDSRASAVVVLDNFAHTVEEVLADTEVHHVVTTRAGDMLPFPKAQIVNVVVKYVRHMVPPWHIEAAVPLPKALLSGAELSLEEAAPNRDDMAFLQYTGGTTGVPKGAILSHGNLLANIEQTRAWAGDALAEGKETLVIPLPLYHIFALMVMLTFCRLGAHSVLITNPRDLPSFMGQLRHTRFSAIIGVNTLFNALLNAPDLGHIDTSALRLCLAGGMAVQRSVAERWKQKMGLPIIEGYGLTEASPIVCANLLTIQEYTGTIGLPIPSTECAFLDDEGRELPQGELGELCVRGPQVMQGYWNMPEETARVFTADGWLRTGDMGFMNPDGYIKLVDRKKDMIVVSGFKVFPNEVEDVVALHPGVYEVAAIRAADEHSDEVVKIVVVPKDPALNADELLRHCRENLAPYKVPKYVVFRSEPLPKSNIGKILRRVVAEDEKNRMATTPAAA